MNLAKIRIGEKHSYGWCGTTVWRLRRHDDLISQIDTNYLFKEQAEGKEDELNGFDEIDTAKSQINTEQLQQDTEFPIELMERYNETATELNQEIVDQLEQEDDEDHDMPPASKRSFPRVTGI